MLDIIYLNFITTRKMKDDENKKPEDKVEEFSTELKGTFFDTYEFSGDSPKIDSPETTKKEEGAKEKIEDDKSKEGATAESTEKKEEEEVKKEDIPEETQKEFDAAATALKAKDEKDLDDEEKEFLKSYEEGTLGVVEESAGYVELAKTLIDKGVLVNDDEELEDSEESFQGVIAKTVDAKVDAYIAEIPDEYKNIIDFMRAGGKPDEYLQNKAAIDYANLDLTKEHIQTALVKADLEQQGYSPEEVVEKIQDYKDLDRMEKEASKASKTFDKQQTERLAAYDASIQKEIDDKIKADEREVEEVIETIDKMDEIAGFKLTPKRKEAFKKYLFDTDADGETAASKASREVDNRIKLYFMDFVGYNFDDLEKSVTTKKTKDFRKILSRYKDTATQATGISVEELDPTVEQELKIPSMFNQAADDD